jgi:hypothetical protein
MKSLRINIAGKIQTMCVPCFGYTWMYDFVLVVRCVRMMKIKSDAIRKEIKEKSILWFIHYGRLLSTWVRLKVGKEM